jgi:putative protease
MVGRIRQAGRDWVELESIGANLKPGDGVVFDTGGDTNDEQGGRVFELWDNRLTFARGKVDFSVLKPGDRVWKTNDPALDKRLRATFEKEAGWKPLRALDLQVKGQEGAPLELSCGLLTVYSSMPLVPALKRPLSNETLQDQLGRLGGTAYTLGNLECSLTGDLMLPVSELNRMRRELIAQLDAAAPAQETVSHPDKPAPNITVGAMLEAVRQRPAEAAPDQMELSVLCRTLAQVEACAAAGVAVAYADFEDVRGYAQAVQLVRDTSAMRLLLATPRIQKPGEQGFFKLIGRANPHGVLVRNLGAMPWFTHRGLETTGDFSLNIANPLSAAFFKDEGLDLLTISYDLNITQVLELLAGTPPAWFELTLHQHMPMFHMEHCVFAAFMSQGKTFLDCGRPCEKHSVKLRDRVGMEHPLKADVGCRNTLFNAQAQTGARYFTELHAAGLRRCRIELLEEDAAGVRRVLQTYRALLEGQAEGADLWRSLKAQSKLGVTLGTLETQS